MPKRKRPPMLEFAHRRLPSPRSIRLLSLHPSPNLSTPLEISLLEASLDDFPSDRFKYEALSYVWGAPIGSLPCTCDGKQLLITSNCDDALRHLRLPSQHRTLWVDAICIDQGNSRESIEERNTQITLMGEVYQTAERTLCWLGIGEEYTTGTFERLRRMGDCSSKRELKKLLGYDEKLRRKGSLEENSTCLNHIFCHSWHSRIWTLQEVAFSKDCQIIVGREAIPWDFYVKASRFLTHEEFIDELDARAWKSSLGIKLRDEFRKALLCPPSESHHNETFEFLTTNLTHIRHLQATNPKDKIYGLYAILSNLGISLPAPDYGKPLAKIYEEGCLSIILHSKSLQILEHACSNARAQDLPSWVVDLQDEDVILKTPPGNTTDGSRISQTDLSTLSPASGQLRVRGILVGSITTRAENDFGTLEFPPDSLSILTEEKYDLIGSEVDSLRMLLHRLVLFREWMHLCDGIPSPYDAEDPSDNFHKLVTFSTSSLHSAFSSESSDAHLFSAWTNILQYPDTSYDLSDAETIVETWKKADDTNSRSWTPELSQCAVVAAALLQAKVTGKDNPVPADLLDFNTHICGDLGNRALIFVREPLLDEMLPGTAFHMAMVGDCVAVLEGADNPVGLRRKDDCWSFVGPAFVLGLMDGEGWLEEDLQDFLLA